MAHRYKKAENNHKKKTQVVLAATSIVMLIAVMIGFVVKSLSHNAVTVIKPEESITEQSSAENVPSTGSVFSSNDFSSAVVEAMNVLSGKSSSVNSSKIVSSTPKTSPTPTPKPTATPTPSPTSTPTPTPTPTPTVEDIPNLTIMGANNVNISAEKMATFLLKNYSKPKINCTVWELVNYYLNEGKDIGVRGDIAFCQSINETGFFQYGNLVTPDMNNFSGLGATGDLVNGVIEKGCVFSTPQKGVKAQIRHLHLYACKSNDILYSKKDPFYTDDPRYGNWLKGTAIKWTDLAGKWAKNLEYILNQNPNPDINKRTGILDVYVRIINTPVDQDLVAKSKQIIKWE